MLKDLIIIGAGGVGRETALIIEEINNESKEWNLLGFVDDYKEINEDINGYKVLGGNDYINNYNEEVYVVCAIANYKIKKNIVENIKNDNVKFANIIHPSVKLNRTVDIGYGCIIYQNSIITANISIGNHVIVSPRCGIGHDSILNDYRSILWNVNISGNVVLEEGVTMGSGSTIIQGKKVGCGSFIGAGAVVIENIEKCSVAVGVPTRYVEKMGIAI